MNFTKELTNQFKNQLRSIGFKEESNTFTDLKLNKTINIDSKTIVISNKNSVCTINLIESLNALTLNVHHKDSPQSKDIINLIHFTKTKFDINNYETCESIANFLIQEVMS